MRFVSVNYTKMKFSIKDFFSQRDQIRRKQRIWSHLLKKSLLENFIFGAVIFNIFYLTLLHFGRTRVNEN